LQLLIDRAHDGLDAWKPKAGDEDALRRALDAYKAVQALTMERMGEDAPVVSKVTRILEEKLRAVPKAAPAAPSAPASGDGAPAPSTPAPAPAAPSSPDGFRSPAEAAQVVTAAAAFLHG